VFVSPEFTDTEAAVDFEDAALTWASRGDTPVRWTEFEDETAAVERWRDRGFLPTDEGYLNLTRVLDDAVAEAERDDRVQPVGDDDVEDRASITHAAFRKKRPFAQYAAEYAGFRASRASGRRLQRTVDRRMRDHDSGRAFDEEVSCSHAFAGSDRGVGEDRARRSR
jgi:hypothetical protein